MVRTRFKAHFLCWFSRFSLAAARICHHDPNRRDIRGSAECRGRIALSAAAPHGRIRLGFREVDDHREQTPRARLRNNCGRPQAIEGNRSTLASRHGGGRPGFAKSLGAEILEEPCPGFRVSLMYFAVTA